MLDQKQKSQIDLLESASLVTTNNVALETLSLERSMSLMSRCCNVRWESIEITIEKSKMKFEEVEFEIHEIQQIDK